MKLMRKWHPDRHVNSSEEEKMIADRKARDINEAWAVL
jgi:curved DNA-binding protein CbpA